MCNQIRTLWKQCHVQRERDNKNMKICQFWGKGFMSLSQKYEEKVRKFSFFAQHHFKGTELKICQYLCLHMKMICRRFRNKTSFIFWDIRTWDMWKVCLQTFRNNRICKKLAYFLRHLQTSRANNYRTSRIKNAKFWGYCFYVNTTSKKIFKSALGYL